MQEESGREMDSQDSKGLPALVGRSDQPPPIAFAVPF